ncbi:MAG: MerR family transcriptional regulator [Coriobacteriales bacterium]|jgi:DNA-binding transcriptional MerR regulator
MRAGRDDARGYATGRYSSEDDGAADAVDGVSMPAYRIGMVTRALDLGQYTLKHYERAGLISPRSSPESGFRFYTRSEFGRIIVIRSLRRMGFSVEEIASLLDGDARGTLDAYVAKREENARRIAELQEANRMLERRIGTLRAFLDRPGDGEPVEVPRFQFMGHFRNDELNEGVDALTSSELWRESYQRAHLALRLPREGVLRDDGTFWWGLVLFEDELEELRREDPARADSPAAADGVTASEVGGAAAPDAARGTSDDNASSCVVRVERHRAVALSVTTASDRAYAAIRAAAMAALTRRGLPLAGDVYAVAEAQALVDDAPADARARSRRHEGERMGMLSLTVEVPVGDGSPHTDD